jgi:hypothetical protein
MKNSIIKLLGSFFLFILSFSVIALELDGCNQSQPYLADGQDDINSILVDFANNCCANSVISIFDFNTMELQTYFTPQDGPNSSCDRTPQAE